MVPTPFNPEDLYTGHLDTFNGGLSAAGILMGLIGNYRGAQKLAEELIAGGTVGKDDMPTVAYFAQQARDIQESISDDIARMKELSANGDPNSAKTFLAGLKGILPEGDARLTAIETHMVSAKQSASEKQKAAAESADEVEDVEAQNGAAPRLRLASAFNEHAFPPDS